MGAPAAVSVVAVLLPATAGVEWAPSSKSVFLVQIQVEALDRSGLLSDVTRVLSEYHVALVRDEP